MLLGSIAMAGPNTLADFRKRITLGLMSVNTKPDSARPVQSYSLLLLTARCGVLAYLVKSGSIYG